MYGFHLSNLRFNLVARQESSFFHHQGGQLLCVYCQHPDFTRELCALAGIHENALELVSGKALSDLLL